MAFFCVFFLKQFQENKIVFDRHIFLSEDIRLS